jgi:ribosome biogenesis ATPase
VEHPESSGVVAPLTEEEMDPLYVTMDDFLQAVPLVQPSSKREGFATVPDVSWNDIGALTSVREELTLSVLEPIRNPEKFATLGLSLPAGVSSMVRLDVVRPSWPRPLQTNQAVTFYRLRVQNYWINTSESQNGPFALSLNVQEAQVHVSSFFDELDSLCPKRGSDGGGGGGVSERVVNQLLTENGRTGKSPFCICHRRDESTRTH